MDLSVDCDSAAIGSLFQQIIIEMKSTSPLWEDFVAKATKLHTCLKAVIQAIASYLDAFQKIADAATNSRGASKEIGTALTRVCLRHKAVETRMKTFTSAIMDCLIIPLQDKVEDWKRQVASIDKEHAKEYKKCRTELKKRSTDTLRLQKKARKDQSDTIQSLVDSHMQDISLRRAELEEVERKSLRAAMIEERMRYCTFVNMLQPVVKEECEVMSELGHLQEAMESIAIVTKDPNILPQSSEEIIQETRPSLSLYPESPGGGSNSLGSRKSSVCSISSVNSSGSSGSPGHNHYQRSLSQLISPKIRLKAGKSSDSGFCSSSLLTAQSSATTSQSHTVSTWPPHSQDVQTIDRPHTISSAYEKGHQRPALTVYTFKKPETITESQKLTAPISCRPPLPVRCSSLERPPSTVTSKNSNVNLTQRQSPSPIPAYIAKELVQFQPTYANMAEIASLPSIQGAHQQPQLIQQQKNTNQLSSPNQLIASSRVFFDSSVENGHQLLSSCDLSLGVISTDLTICSTFAEHTIPSASKNLIPITSYKICTSNSKNIINLGLGRNETTDTKTNISCKEELKITETDSITKDLSQGSWSNKDIPSPESDDISRASVQQKASLFEKLEREQNAVNNSSSIPSSRSSNSDNNVENKREEIDRNSGSNQKDSDKMYEDSIKELNNLIVELDSFQREHDFKQLTDKLKIDHQFFIDGNLENTCTTNSISDKISIRSFSTSMLSINTNESKSNCSHIDTSRSVNEYAIETKISSSSVNRDPNSYDIACKKATLSSEHADMSMLTPNFNASSDLAYVKDNSSVVLLRCKQHRSIDYVDNSVSNSSQRFSSFRCEQLNSSSPEFSCQQTLNKPNGPIIQGCATGITRRSSSNNIKPPPPVRRSSSVTPSHNLQTQNSTNPFQGSPTNISTESLPPPPAFLLDRTGNESSAVNVAETVKALTVIKHTPASPTVLRRAQSQQIHLQMTGAQNYSAANTPSGGNAQPKHVTKMSSFRAQSPTQINSRLLSHKQGHQQQPNNTTCKNNMNQLQTYHEVQNSHNQTNLQQASTKQIFSYSEEAKQAIYWHDQQIQSDDHFYHRHNHLSTNHLQQHSICYYTPTSVKQQTPALSHLGPTQQRQSHAQFSAHDRLTMHQRTVVSTNPFLTATDVNCSSSSLGKQFSGTAVDQNYPTTSVGKAESIFNKTKAEFLHNLNVKLAKQGLSGRAFAVRNIINSKALPDPRVCHESLMDQIKRGATLKRNRTINDRSAPIIR